MADILIAQHAACDVSKDSSQDESEVCNLRRNTIPLEIWTKIISYLFSKRDVKSVMLTCKMLHPVAREMLWSTPEFKHPLDLGHLKALVELGLPIRQLKLTQLDLGVGLKERNTNEYVDFLSANFSLTYFHVDRISSSFSPKKYFLDKLPVKELNTRYFLDPRDFAQFFAYLQGMENCPEIILDLRNIDLDEEDRKKMIAFVEKRFQDSYRAQVRRDEQRVRDGSVSWLHFDLEGHRRWEERLMLEDSPSYYLTESESESDSSLPLKIVMILNLLFGSS